MYFNGSGIWGGETMHILILAGFTFKTVVNEFHRFLSQFSTNFHEILHTIFSIHNVTTMKVSQSFDKLFI